MDHNKLWFTFLHCIITELYLVELTLSPCLRGSVYAESSKTDRFLVSCRNYAAYMDTCGYVTYVTLLSHCFKLSIKIFGCYICPCRSHWKSRVRWSSWDGVLVAWWKSNWTPPEINLLRTGTLEGIESQRKPVRSYPIHFSETFWLTFTSKIVEIEHLD